MSDKLGLSDFAVRSESTEEEEEEEDNNNHLVPDQEAGQILCPANLNSEDGHGPQLTSLMNLSATALVFHAAWTPLPPLLWSADEY